MSENRDLSYEDAFLRLEQIVEKMNAETVSLDLSLKLYEEADRLIQHCNKKLLDAEQKIEVLSKTRSGELALDESEKPITSTFATSQKDIS